MLCGPVQRITQGAAERVRRVNLFGHLLRLYRDRSRKVWDKDLGNYVPERE